MKIKSKTYIAIPLCVALTACASPMPYQPKTADSRVGYSDEQIAQNRWRITYSGDSLTDRATVEDYLLFRSAQVTQAAGAQWFMFDTRDTKAKTTYTSDFAGWPGWPGHGWYWHSWPYERQFDAFPVVRYEAYAEIVLLTNEQAKAEPRAVNAQDVLDHIGPSTKAKP